MPASIHEYPLKAHHTTLRGIAVNPCAKWCGTARGVTACRPRTMQGGQILRSAPYPGVACPLRTCMHNGSKRIDRLNTQRITSIFSSVTVTVTATAVNSCASQCGTVRGLQPVARGQCRVVTFSDPLHAKTLHDQLGRGIHDSRKQIDTVSIPNTARVLSNTTATAVNPCAKRYGTVRGAVASRPRATPDGQILRSAPCQGVA